MSWQKKECIATSVTQSAQCLVKVSIQRSTLNLYIVKPCLPRKIILILAVGSGRRLVCVHSTIWLWPSAVDGTSKLCAALLANSEKKRWLMRDYSQSPKVFGIWLELEKEDLHGIKTSHTNLSCPLQESHCEWILITSEAIRRLKNDRYKVKICSGRHRPS